MKIKYFPILGTFLFVLAACGPTTNPTTEPSIDPTSEEEVTSIPTTSNDPTSSEESTSKANKFRFSVDVPLIYSNYSGEAPEITTNDDSVDVSQITYEWDTDLYDENALRFENGKFATRTKNLTIPVTATLNGKTDDFKVYTSEYPYEDKVASREKAFNGAYNEYVEGTLFLGDSFFDTDQFWTNFYTTFSGKNARSVGISATQSHDWQMFAERIVYPTSPENIVMHIGTNNMYDGKQKADSAISNLKRLMEQYHEDLPNTHIYFFGIEPRTYALPYLFSIQDTVAELTKVNDAMVAYANENDWFTYLDSPSFCYNADGSVKDSFFKDGIHPKLENYKYYVSLLEDAGITYKRIKGVSNYSDFTTTKTQAAGNTSLVVIHEGVQLDKNYTMSGTLKITEYNGNPHVIFSFDSTNFQNRFLLWDNDANGTFNLGYAVNGGHEAGAPADAQYTVGADGLTIDWKIITTAKNSYMYINGELKIVMLNAPLECLLLATENVATSWTNLSATLKEDDETAWETILADTEIASFEQQAADNSSRRIARS